MTKEENFKIQITKYESFERNMPHHYNGQITTLSEIFNDINNECSILDVGCGDGIALSWFNCNGYDDVEGVDGNPNKLIEANKVGFKTYEGDIHNLSTIVNRKYDVIYCSHVLEHMFDVGHVIEEMKRCLTDNGKIIIIVPYPDKGAVDAHCGKYYLKTDKISPNNLNVVNVFKSHDLNVKYLKVTNIRQDEIFLILNRS